MNKEEFIKLLKSENPSKEDKLKVCEYFLRNYPVNIRAGFNPFTGEILHTWTSLQEFNLEGSSNKAINHAWSQLVKRVNELETFNN